MTPDELYDLVCTYAAFGDHHTGSAADRATTDWLDDLLTSMGAASGRIDYGFDRWTGAAELTLRGGTTVPSVPLFYTAVGDLVVDDPIVIEADRRVAGSAHALTSILARADDDSAVVLALDGPADLPVQCNQVPRPPDGRPAVVIPATWAERVRTGSRLRFTGSVDPATSQVLTGQLGPTDAPPVVVTTPLTGWFACAGERGTGLAVALALTADLAADHRVHFVGCSGHELDHQGLRAWLAASGDPIPGGRVVHLGASVGAVERRPGGGAELASTRLVLTTLDEARHRDLIASAASVGSFTLIDPDPWMGEGTNWREAGAQVLSFLGSFELFHTAADLPRAATDPAAMQAASEAVIATTRHFLHHTSPEPTT